MKYELWIAPDKSYTFLPSNHEQKDILVELNSKLVWEVEADSDEEALRKRDLYLGWGTNDVSDP